MLYDFEDNNGIKTLIAAVRPQQEKITVNFWACVYGKDSQFANREIRKGSLIYKRPNKTVPNNIVTLIVTETLKPSNNIISNDKENSKRVDINNDKWITIHPH